MKIKEVIRITELTDKAIRLYIDNGLVAPSIDESYSGRKSIEFSADDVERLNNIALLRKAGFSIADIKEIIESDEKAQAVVERFIKETESNIQHETEIIEKLKSIPAENGISLATICESLSKTVEEKKVPKEDIKFSYAEKTLRIFFSCFAIIGALSAVALPIIFISRNYSDYRFLTFDTYEIFVLIGWVLLFFLSAVLFYINFGNYRLNEKKSVRNVISGIFPIFIILLFVVLIFLTFISLLCSSSETQNPKNYLVMDKYVEKNYGQEIRSLFPENTPDTLTKKDIKYIYRFKFDDPSYIDVIAEFTLPQNEFIKLKSTATSKENYAIRETANWTCLYYSGKVLTNKKINWSGKQYSYLIFAYNSNENKVRYIAAYSTDSADDGPYFLTLDW